MNVETLNQRVAAELDDDAISFANAYYGVPLPESIPTCAKLTRKIINFISFLNYLRKQVS